MEKDVEDGKTSAEQIANSERLESNSKADCDKEACQILVNFISSKGCHNCCSYIEALD